MFSGSLLHILPYGYVVQPTPHQSLPSRRSSLLPADGEVEGMPKFGCNSDPCRTLLPSLSNSWGSEIFWSLSLLPLISTTLCAWVDFLLLCSPSVLTSFNLRCLTRSRNGTLSVHVLEFLCCWDANCRPMTNFADFFLEGVQLEMLSIFDQSHKVVNFHLFTWMWNRWTWRSYSKQCGWRLNLYCQGSWTKDVPLRKGLWCNSFTLISCCDWGYSRRFITLDPNFIVVLFVSRIMSVSVMCSISVSNSSWWRRWRKPTRSSTTWSDGVLPQGIFVDCSLQAFKKVFPRVFI
jgi:hypothetical protein